MDSGSDPHAPLRPLLVGLTGGIATGKSLAGRFFLDAGVPVIDADQVGHRVLARDPEVRAALVARLGAGILGPDGAPDRGALAAVVFRDPGARRALEDLLHPRIREECLRLAREAAARGADVVVIEAALLLEAGWREGFDRIVVVTCSPAEQLRRVLARDGVEPEAAAARIRAQMPLAQKEAAADLVLDNDGPAEVLASQVRRLVQGLREQASTRPGGRVGGPGSGDDP